MWDECIRLTLNLTLSTTFALDEMLDEEVLCQQNFFGDNLSNNNIVTFCIYVTIEYNSRNFI